MPARLKPYLTYSGVLHLAFFLGAWGLIRPSAPSSTAVYSIDFVGSTTISDAGASGAAPQAPAGAGDDAMRRSKAKRIALPKPSLLTGYREPARAPAAREEEAPGSSDAAPSAGSSSGASSSGGPDAGIATDMPNFPYPWYISQVRAALWTQWSRRLPAGVGEAIVVFSILPSGQSTDLRIEASSGDSAFDLTALGAVQDAAPFAPLPRGFSEPFLKIHLTLKR